MGQRNDKVFILDLVRVYFFGFAEEKMCYQAYDLFYTLIYSIIRSKARYSPGCAFDFHYL